MKDNYIKIKSQIILRGKIKDFEYKLIPIGNQYVLIEYVIDRDITLVSNTYVLTREELKTKISQLKLENSNLSIPEQFQLDKFLNYIP